jgi:hypothetical protein
VKNFPEKDQKEKRRSSPTSLPTPHPHALPPHAASATPPLVRISSRPPSPLRCSAHHLLAISLPTLLLPRLHYRGACNRPEHLENLATPSLAMNPPVIAGTPTASGILARGRSNRGLPKSTPCSRSRCICSNRVRAYRDRHSRPPAVYAFCAHPTALSHPPPSPAHVQRMRQPYRARHPCSPAFQIAALPALCTSPHGSHEQEQQHFQHPDLRPCASQHSVLSPSASQHIVW